MTAYYRMARGWMQNPALRDPAYSKAQAWCWLIEEAAYRERRVNRLGRTITISRGQLCHSTRFMAEAWGWSAPAVRRFLMRLEVEGMIAKTHRAVAERKLNATRVETDPPGDPPIDAGPLIITLCNYDKYQASPNGIDANGDPPIDAPATHHRPTSDPNENKEKEINEGEDSQGASEQPTPRLEDRESDSVTEAIHRYNVMAGRCGLPSAQRLTEPRRRAIKARLKELGGLDGWDAMLAQVEASPFLVGKVKDFRASLDWLIKPANLTKVMEGNYASDQSPRANGGARRSRAELAVETIMREQPK